MSAVRIALAEAAMCALLLVTFPARAETAGVALVIGNSAYTGLPALPACARSANIVAAALKALGFSVTERIDASIGGIDGGMAEIVERIGAGRSIAFVYVCGYGTSLNDRAFVLPATAHLARPTDIMNQGILLKSVLDTVTRPGISVAVAAFDVLPMPDNSSPPGLETLSKVPLPEGVGFLAVVEGEVRDGPTPFATALAAALEGPVVRSDGLLNNVDAALSTEPASIVVFRLPAFPSYIVGAPRVPMVPIAPQAPPQGPVSPPPPPPSAPAVSLPDEARMTEKDRRDVQLALSRLKYYKGPVNGKFGPEVQTAISAWQIVIGAQMTGHLTAAQATRLVNSAR